MWESHQRSPTSLKGKSEAEPTHGFPTHGFPTAGILSQSPERLVRAQQAGPATSWLQQWLSEPIPRHQPPPHWHTPLCNLFTLSGAAEPSEHSQLSLPAPHTTAYRSHSPRSHERSSEPDTAQSKHKEPSVRLTLLCQHSPGHRTAGCIPSFPRGYLGQWPYLTQEKKRKKKGKNQPQCEMCTSERHKAGSGSDLALLPAALGLFVKQAEMEDTGQEQNSCY